MKINQLLGTLYTNNDGHLHVLEAALIYFTIRFSHVLSMYENTRTIKNVKLVSRCHEATLRKKFVSGGAPGSE